MPALARLRPCLRQAVLALVLPAAIALGIGRAPAADPPEQPVSYHKQIRPIFQANCQGCHQPAKAEGGFVMTEVAKMLAAGDSATPGIVPGNPDASHLLAQITPDASGVAEMPKAAKPLAASEIALVRRWIAEGARDDTPASAGQRVDAEHPPVYTRPPVITSLDFSPDGKLLAVSGFHEVLLFDVSSGEPPAAPARRLVGLAERIERVRFSPDGTKLAVTGGSPARMGEVQIWNVADGALLRSVPVTFDTVYGGSWSPDGTLIAFGCADNTLRAIRVDTGEQVLHQGAHEDWVLDTVFSPKGDHVVSVGRDMSVKLTERATQRFVDNITSITPGALRGGLSAVDRHPALDHVVVAGSDGLPRVYRIHRHSPRVIGDDANLIFPLFPVTGRVFNVRFSPDGKRIAAVGSLDGKGELVVCSYGLEQDVPKNILDIMAKVPGDARRQGSQRSGDEWQAMDAFRDASTKPLAKVELPAAAAYAVAFHPTSGGVAVGGGDGIVRFFDATSGSPGISFPVAKVDAAAVARAALPLPWPTEASLEPEPAPPAAVAAIAVEPPAVALEGPFATAQLVVTGRLVDGRTVDLTRSVRIEPAPASAAGGDAKPLVTVGPGGLVRPLADGSGALRVVHGDGAATVSRDLPVSVAGTGGMPDVDFIRDVNPVLAKLGCNQGTCHGAAKGKNGFKLSLRGYDPVFDVRALTDDHGSRRVNLASPDDSLMLLKASATAPHAGGLLAKVDEPAYQLVRRWIEQGGRLEEAAPRVTGIKVFPAAAEIDAAGRRQQFRVVAEYADGRTRDVTREAFLESGNNEVATADKSGLVTALRRGEAPILARYEGAYAAVTLTVMGDRTGFEWVQPETWGPIDDLVAAKWKSLKTLPAPLCSDDEFLRRITLDLTGLPPTAPEVRAFMNDQRDTRIKRAQLVSRLLASDAFIEHWTNKWADLLQVNPKFLGAEGAKGLRDWIRGQVAANTPYDRFAREILTATGSNREHPAAAYFKTLRDPLATMENTTHLFLGVRFNCNKCHDHPFERWTQDQYFQTAAYFAQVDFARDPESGDRTIGGTAVEGAKPLYEIVSDKAEGEVVHERTAKPVPPKFPFDCRYTAPDKATRRQELAAWITSPDNAYFARSYVNRLWGYLFGTGIIDPIDDIRAGNPPSNPQLLDHLTTSFIAGGFDVRRLLAEICTSRTYGLAIETSTWNSDDRINYSHALPRRLPAETLFDSLHAVVGSPTKFPGYPVGTRAAQLPDVASSLGGGFLQTFGKPARESACECERASGLALGPVMALVSGPAVGDVLADPQSELAKLVAAQPDDNLLIEEVFLRILNRPSRPAEVEAVKKLTGEVALDHESLSAELSRVEADWKGRLAKLEEERAARIASARAALVEAAAAYEPIRIDLEQKRAERIAQAVESLEKYHADPQATLSRLETEAAKLPAWRVLPPAQAASRAKATLRPLADGSLLAEGPLADDTTTLTIPLPLERLTGLRLEAIADASLPNGGPGRAPDGNFVVTEIVLEVAPASRPQEITRVALYNPQADFSQGNLGVALAIDGDMNPGLGWAVAPRMRESHWAVFEVKDKLEFKEPMVATVRIEQRFSGGKHALGRFRVSFTDSAAPLALGLPVRLGELASIPRDRRTPWEAAEFDALIAARDPAKVVLSAELASASLPVPPDPKHAPLAQALAEAEKPVPEDPAVVRLRAEHAASTQQVADRRLTVIQDLAWALINSPAFFFNH
jgi:WD40 repeat protein/mono/diheme cytochrome c family protein